MNARKSRQRQIEDNNRQGLVAYVYIENFQATNINGICFSFVARRVVRKKSWLIVARSFSTQEKFPQYARSGVRGEGKDKKRERERGQKKRSITDVCKRRKRLRSKFSASGGVPLRRSHLPNIEFSFLTPFLLCSLSLSLYIPSIFPIQIFGQRHPYDFRLSTNIITLK